MSAENPQSEQWREQTPRKIQEESSSATDDFSHVPRSAAGTVNKTGEVVDEAGNTIGKISDSKNPQELVGNAVTATGDIVNSTGDVLGDALLDDDKRSEYTTESHAGDHQEQKQKDSWLSGVTKPVTGLARGIGGGWGQKDQQDPQTKSETNIDDHSQADEDFDHLKVDQSRPEITSSPQPIEEKAEGTPVETATSDTKDQTEEVDEQLQNTTEDTQKVEDESFKKDGFPKQEDTTESVEQKADDAAGLKSQTEDIPETKDDKDIPAKAKDESSQQESDTLDQAKENITDDDKATTQGEDTSKALEQPSEEVTDDPAKEMEETSEDAKQKTEDTPESVEKTSDAIQKGTQEATEEAKEDTKAALDFSILKGTNVNKTGNLVDESGRIMGRVSSGELKNLIGKTADEKGQIWDKSGKVVGQAEPLSESDREDVNKPIAAFENFTDAVVEADGRVMFEGKQVGTVVDGDAKKLKGSKIDKDGDILDRNGNIVGKADPWDEPEEEPEAEKDFSPYAVLKGTKVNKAGNLVDNNNSIVGRISSGEAKDLIGKTSDEKGQIWDNSGKVVGQAEPLSDSEREDLNKSSGPFENFPDAIVEADGKVMHGGQQVGVVVEGDAKKLKGSKVDSDGDVVDRAGNVVGKAEPWEAPEEEPEPETDYSSLAGKRVNKAGNVVSSSGEIYGRVVEGNVKNMIGRMCDKKGNILSESGDIIGRAELVSEGEREGAKEGPFAELSGLTVSKDGKVVTPSGDVVGRLTSGDGKKLAGRTVDEDGDVVDNNGNVLAKAERWEEPEVEKKKGPMAGRKVNREGNVVDEEGNIIGKLTSGDLGICSGKEIDDDGDVVDSKGNTVGHVNLLEDIPKEEELKEEEPLESEEDKQKREQVEQDKQLAGQLAAAVEQSLDKVRPICKRITQKIDAAERTPKEELDEEQLVKEVKPLLEDGNSILTETNGIIRGMDPDGRIQRNAKHHSSMHNASPEEHHLAEVIKELTGTVSECIDNGKRKIEGMPKAKKELSPLWGLLAEPLGQILAAVGLLLNGVLGLVGKLLGAIGLGGLVDNLLGTLGIGKILKGLGLGDTLGSLTGKKK